MEIEEAIRKYAIKNAIDYGKASEKAVLGKVLSGIPDARSDMKALTQSIAKIVAQVNQMDKAELEREYSRHESEFAAFDKKKAEEAVPKFVLEGAVKGDFATRYAPAPNGYMHIGHIKAALMAREFATIYEGKIFLYFDDTNPEKDKQEYVDEMKKDLQWAGIKFDDEYYASDNIDAVYNGARKLISEGRAYVCECDGEKISKERYEGKECAHRSRPQQENIELFEKMVGGKIGEGEAILRFRGDMSSQNTTLRDPVIIRIKKQEHYRQGKKYFAWPTYDLNTPIMDSMHGVTDVIRSKEFELRDELAAMILDALGLRKPKIHSEARLVISNNVTHKRELNELISGGELMGWDDPRLVTVSALRRRGIVPEAIWKFVLRFGMSKTDSKVDISMLLSENRKIIDATSKRLFYVEKPVLLRVKGNAAMEVSLRMHPGSEIGNRKYEIGEELFISANDAAALKVGSVVRLKDLFDVKILGTGNEPTAERVHDLQYTWIIQWVPGNSYVECSVMIPGNPVDKDHKFLKESMGSSGGYVEGYARQLEKHETIQFERFGFCILDSKQAMQFIFISK